MHGIYGSLEVASFFMVAGGFFFARRQAEALLANAGRRGGYGARRGARSRGA